MAAHLLTQSGGAQHKIYGGAPGKGGFYKEFVFTSRMLYGLFQGNSKQHK